MRATALTAPPWDHHADYRVREVHRVPPHPQIATITGTRGDSTGRKVTVGYDSGCNRTSLTQTATVMALI